MNITALLLYYYERVFSHLDNCFFTSIKSKTLNVGEFIPMFATVEPRSMKISYDISNISNKIIKVKAVKRDVTITGRTREYKDLKDEFGQQIKSVFATNKEKYIYFEDFDVNGNGQLDEGIDEHLTFSNPELVGITSGYDEYYNDNNSNAFNYFEDSGLIPEQGYCYYVTDFHPSLSYITLTYLDDVDNQKMCLATECITAEFLEDQDNDGLGTPVGQGEEPISQCGAPPGYVDNDNDEHPDCPNINGDNPYDCAGECFDWNDSDVQNHQFEVDINLHSEVQTQIVIKVISQEETKKLYIIFPRSI